MLCFSFLVYIISLVALSRALELEVRVCVCVCVCARTRVRACVWKLPTNICKEHTFTTHLHLLAQIQQEDLCLCVWLVSLDVCVCVVSLCVWVCVWPVCWL